MENVVTKSHGVIRVLAPEGIAARFVGGETATGLASALGVPVAAIFRCLDLCGIEHKRRGPLVRVDHRQVAADYWRNLPVEEIAKRNSCSVSLVRKLAKGHTMARDPGPAPRASQPKVNWRPDGADCSFPIPGGRVTGAVLSLTAKGGGRLQVVKQFGGWSVYERRGSGRYSRADRLAQNVVEYLWRASR